MRKYGAEGTAREFFELINEHFHNEEAAVYDKIHAEMWDILPRQFELLVADACQEIDSMRPTTLIDIGCGTGLAFELFRSTSLGRSIDQVHLLDTSSSMLSAARDRGTKWAGVRLIFFKGEVSELEHTASFDVALACSVLHHIPDLPGFFGEVDRILKPGSLFFHFQDQNDDADFRVLTRRKLEVPRPARNIIRSALAGTIALDVAQRSYRVLKQVFREGRGDEDYIARTNKALLTRGVIKRAMAAQDLWRVTDIHVGDELGISLRQMRCMLPHYELLSARTYQFFGQPDQLTPRQKREEESLINDHDMNGSLLAAVWRKKS